MGMQMNQKPWGIKSGMEKFLQRNGIGNGANNPEKEASKGIKGLELFKR